MYVWDQERVNGPTHMSEARKEQMGLHVCLRSGKSEWAYMYVWGQERKSEWAYMYVWGQERVSGHMFVAGLDIVFGFQAKFCVKNLHTGDGVSFAKKIPLKWSLLKQLLGQVWTHKEKDPPEYINLLECLNLVRWSIVSKWDVCCELFTCYW